MAQWQIFTKGIANELTFDDGLWPAPGEDGFSVEAVKAEITSRKADGFSYIGRSTVASDAMADHIDARADVIHEAAVDALKAKLASEALQSATEPTEVDIEAAHADAAAQAEEASPVLREAARLTALKDMGLSPSVAS